MEFEAKECKFEMDFNILKNGSTGDAFGMIGSPTLRKLGGTLKLREQGGSVLTLTDVPGYSKWLHLPVTFQQDISKSKAVRALATQSAKKKGESGAFNGSNDAATAAPQPPKPAEPSPKMTEQKSAKVEKPKEAQSSKSQEELGELIFASGRNVSQ